jgi:hypothetical protein
MGLSIILKKLPVILLCGLVQLFEGLMAQGGNICNDFNQQNTFPNGYCCILKMMGKSSKFGLCC